ncbi:MAG: hypothetical protein K8R58_08060, partial [Bacteroidales bacterium]|nr:hypothetical protein [Bacteroidales bacterium]
MKIFTKICLVIGVLFLSSTLVMGQDYVNNDADPNATIKVITGSSDALFDFQFEFPVGVGGGEAGIECDGINIYSTKWNGGDFYKYQLDGTYLESFTVAGASNIRDLAYDGTYFYGGSASTTVYEMDFPNKVLISSFSAPTDVRAIGYNEDDDWFYANNWGSAITCFDRSGGIISSWGVGPTGDSYYGFAYDNYSGSETAYLWGYAQIGANLNELVQMELPSGTETGVYLDVSSVTSCTGMAGGLFIDNCFVTDFWTIAGLCQNDYFWGLELCPDGSGPTVIYEDDFESYNVGDYLAETNPTWWTTWSNAPGTPEDALITDAQAQSGSKSVMIDAGTDCVFPIPNYTNNVYHITFSMYVPSGYFGYFNILQEFAGAGSLWGMQVYFDAGGVGNGDAGGADL